MFLDRRRRSLADLAHLQAPSRGDRICAFCKLPFVGHKHTRCANLWIKQVDAEKAKEGRR